MDSIIIHTSNKKDLSLLKELAQKMGFQSQVLTHSDKEGFVLAKAIEANSPTDQLSMEDAISYYQSLEKSK